MQFSATVDVRRVLAALAAIRTKTGRAKSNVEVKYQAPYAVFVHEDLQAKHAVGKAKYLEDPANRLQGQMAADVAQVIKNKQSLESGLLRAGNRLAVESQKEVPVDTGYLKQSVTVTVV